MSERSDVAYLGWARAHAGRQRLCLRGSGMPSRALPSPLPPLPSPTAPHDDLWHERQIARAIAQRHGVTPEEVFVALGPSGANAACLATLLAGGDPQRRELLCERPVYDPLWRAGRALGCPVHFFDRDLDQDWRLDPLALEAQLSHETRAVIVTRPHNPSGVDIPEPVLHTLGELAEAHDLHVVVDEVYLDFVPGAQPAHRIHPALISTASLTKVYGLSELRLGWVLAPADIVRQLNERRLHAEALLPTLPHAMALALWDRLDAWREEARARALQGYELMRGALEGLPGVRLVPPAQTPFGFLQVPGDADALVQALERRDVGVTPGWLFQAPEGVRIGWTRPPEQLEEAAGILRETLLERA
jgi:aspartate/methionine/tyrosine aminotransferase